MGIHDVLPLVLVIEGYLRRNEEIPRLASRLDAVRISFPPLQPATRATTRFEQIDLIVRAAPRI